MKNTYEGRNLKGVFEIKINFSSSIRMVNALELMIIPRREKTSLGPKKKYRCPLQGTSVVVADDRPRATGDRDRSSILWSLALLGESSFLACLASFLL